MGVIKVNPYSNKICNIKNLQVKKKQQQQQVAANDNLKD